MIPLIVTLLIGLIVGAVAKFVMPGGDPGGTIATMLLGIAGSLLASYGGRAVGIYESNLLAAFLMSVCGSVALLVLYRLLRGSGRSV